MYVYNACWIMLVTSSITFQRANADELTNFGMIYKVDRRLVLPSHSFTWLQGLCSGWHTHTDTHMLIRRHGQRCVCGVGEGKGRGRSFYLQQLLLINSKSFISPCVCVCVRICCSLLFYCATHMFAKHANCVSDVDGNATLRSRQIEFAN